MILTEQTIVHFGHVTNIFFIVEITAQVWVPFYCFELWFVLKCGEWDLPCTITKVIHAINVTY